MPSLTALLSLGCGAEQLDLRTGGWTHSGILRLAPKLAEVFMAAQSDASCGTATHLLGARENFVRISPPLPSGRYGIDVTRELPSLRARGETAARHELQKIKPRFFGEKAEPFLPFRRL